MAVDFPFQPGWAQKMEARLTRRLEKIMSNVTIDQDTLNAYASTVETEVTAITGVATVLGNYITTLVAAANNSSTPPPAADVAAIQQALSDLGTSVGNLQGLEPPTPAPGS